MFSDVGVADAQQAFCRKIFWNNGIKQCSHQLKGPMVGKKNIKKLQTWIYLLQKKLGPKLKLSTSWLVHFPYDHCQLVAHPEWMARWTGIRASNDFGIAPMVLDTDFGEVVKSHLLLAVEPPSVLEKSPFLLVQQWLGVSNGPMLRSHQPRDPHLQLLPQTSRPRHSEEAAWTSAPAWNHSEKWIYISGFVHLVWFTSIESLQKTPHNIGTNRWTSGNRKQVSTTVQWLCDATSTHSTFLTAHFSTKHFSARSVLRKFTPLDIHICPKLASFALLIHHIFQPQGLVLGHQEAR